MALSNHTLDRRLSVQMAPEADTEREGPGKEKQKSGRSQHNTAKTAEVVTAAMIFCGIVWLAGWILSRILLAVFP